MKIVWIAIGAAAVFTALVVTDVLAIGVRGQWTFGVYREEIPPHYERVYLPVLGAMIMAGALAAAWQRLSVERKRWERAGWLALVMAGGLAHLVGLIAMSRAGMAEPAIVARIDWAGGYFNDALRLRGEPAIFKRYGELRGQLSLHGRAHPPGPVAVNLFALAYFRSFSGATERVMALARAAGADISALPLPEMRESAAWAKAPPPVEEDWQWAALTATAWFVVLASALPAIFLYQIG